SSRRRHPRFSRDWSSDVCSSDLPTAIVYDNDVMAVAGLSAARQAGLAVPADLSIVSWEDSTLCRVTHPTLTALSRDAFRFGSTRSEERRVGKEGRRRYAPGPPKL